MRSFATYQSLLNLNDKRRIVMAERENKCYTKEARDFENRLSELSITFDDFLDLCVKYGALTLSAKAEVNDLLRGEEEEIEH